MHTNAVPRTRYRVPQKTITAKRGPRRGSDVVASSQQRRTHLRPRLAVIVSCGIWYRARVTAFICIMPCLLTSIAFFQFLIVNNTRDLAPRATEIHWFWASMFLSSRRTIGIRTRVSLFHAEFLLFRNPYCLF